MLRRLLAIALIALPTATLAAESPAGSGAAGVDDTRLRNAR